MKSEELIMRKIFLSSLLKHLIPFGIFLFTFIAMRGQTVDSLLNESISNNPHFKSLEKKITAAENKAVSAGNYPPPQISLEFGNIPFGKYNPFRDALTNSLSFSQMFPLGGKPAAMYDAEFRNVDVLLADVGLTKVNLRSEIKMIYYNIWLLNKKLVLQEQNTSFLESLESSLQTLYGAGKASMADILTVQNEKAANETKVIILDKKKKTEIIKLNNLVGRVVDSSPPIIADNPEIIQGEVNWDSIYTGIFSHPAIIKMDKMIEMNKAIAIANKKELIPDLMLSAIFMRMPKGMLLTSASGAEMSNQSPDYGFSLMASLTLPFAPWSVDKFNAKDAEIRAENESIYYDREEMLRGMEAKLKEAGNKLETALNLIALYKKSLIPGYESLIETLTSQLQNGDVNINGVIDAERMLIMQYTDYYMAVADYQMALAEIEMMSGKIIK